MHPIIEYFVNEVKTARQPCFITENQVVCGRIVINASPSIDSKNLKSLRLEMPLEMQLNEPTYFYMFLVAVFGPDTFCDFEPRIKPAMLATGEFSETISGWKLRMFIRTICAWF
jgi:hypothetical protein